MPFVGIVVYNRVLVILSVGLVVLTAGLVVPTVGFVVTNVVFVIHILPNVGSDEAIVCPYRVNIGLTVTNVGAYQANGMYADALVIQVVLLDRSTH